MRVKLKGAAGLDVPEYLGQRLIGFGLATEIVVTAEPQKPSLKMKREDLVAIAEGLGYTVQVADNKADILAMIEAGPKKSDD